MALGRRLPLVLLVLALAACGGSGGTKKQAAAPPQTTTDAAGCRSVTPPAGKARTESKPTKQLDQAKTYDVVVTTNCGDFTIGLAVKTSPATTASFASLAQKGFFDGTKFHRVIPGFMIQGGDPNTKTSNRAIYGQGGPGYTIKGEMNDTPHKRGILSMARTGDPDGAGSQFFIVVKDSMFLNPTLDASGKPVPGAEGYTAFGRCVDGMDVVDKIVNLDRDQSDDPNPGNPANVKSIKIVKWPLK